MGVHGLGYEMSGSEKVLKCDDMYDRNDMYMRNSKRKLTIHLPLNI
jgi:hypothetical protein